MKTEVREYELPLVDLIRVASHTFTVSADFDDTVGNYFSLSYSQRHDTGSAEARSLAHMIALFYRLQFTVVACPTASSIDTRHIATSFRTSSSSSTLSNLHEAVMPRQSIVKLPVSILNRPVATEQKSKPTLDGLPNEIRLQTLQYMILFTRINVLRCSVTLAAFVYRFGLLNLDPDDLSATDEALLLEFVPVEMRVAELKRELTEVESFANDDLLVDSGTESDADSDTDFDKGKDTGSDTDDNTDNDTEDDADADITDTEPSPHLFYAVNVHPDRLYCKVCNFRCLVGDTINSPAFRTAWVRQVRMEVLRAGGRVPKPKLMVPLVVRAIRLLVEDHERKLQRASCLTLRVPALSESNGAESMTEH